MKKIRTIECFTAKKCYVFPVHRGYVANRVRTIDSIVRTRFSIDEGERSPVKIPCPNQFFKSNTVSVDKHVVKYGAIPSLIIHIFSSNG